MTSAVGQHPPPGRVWQSSVQNIPAVGCRHAGGTVCGPQIAGSVGCTHCCCSVIGGQTKQCVCTVGVGWMAAAAANCCCPCCTGVPGGGGGQFGLTAILQICGCVIGMQSASRVCKQPTKKVLQVSVQIVAAVGWCPQPTSKVLQVSVQIVA